MVQLWSGSRSNAWYVSHIYAPPRCLVGNCLDSRGMPTMLPLYKVSIKFYCAKATDIPGDAQFSLVLSPYTEHVYTATKLLTRWFASYTCIVGFRCT